MNDGYVKFSEKPPKVGDLGYIMWGKKEIPVAVIRHWIKSEVLCFLRTFAGMGEDTISHDINAYHGPNDLWKPIKNTQEANECTQWVLNIQPERSKREDLERGCGALNSMET